MDAAKERYKGREMKHTNANWKYIPSNGAYIVIDFTERTVKQSRHIPAYRHNRIVFSGEFNPAIAGKIIDIVRWVRTDPLRPIDAMGRIDQWIHHVAEIINGRWVDEAL